MKITKAKSNPAPRKLRATKGRVTLLSDEELRKLAAGLYTGGLNAGGLIFYDDDTKCGKSSCFATTDVCCP